MSNFERKFGRYAIKNLSLILIICYAVGYVVQLIPAFSPALNYITLNPQAIISGQVWRIVSWILIPPSSFGLFTLIMLYFYYSIGHTLEQIWGDYRYNLYILGGMLFTIAGVFAIYIFCRLSPNNPYVLTYGIDYLMEYVGTKVSTYYINLSIFLAFAATFPEHEVLFMFVIPVKMKWMGIFDIIVTVYIAITSDPFSRVIIFASLLNFALFFALFRLNRFGSPVSRVKQAKRKQAFTRKVNAGASTHISKHKCAICGRTDNDFPDLEFRFCSKCNGNYEFCSEHLFTHKHFE